MPNKTNRFPSWAIALLIIATIGAFVRLIEGPGAPKMGDEATLQARALSKLSPEQKARDAAALGAKRQADEAKALGETRFQLAVLGAKELRDSARDPDSFKLTEALLMVDNAVCYNFRAKNGFGGYGRGAAVLSPNGTVLASGSSGFEALWRKECKGKLGDDKTWEVGYAAGLHGLMD